MLKSNYTSPELNNLIAMGLITPDAKNRISIGSILARSNFVTNNIEGFKAFIDPNGMIVLLPVITVPANEAWLYKNPEALTSVNKGIKQALAGQAAPLEHYRKKRKK